MKILKTAFCWLILFAYTFRRNLYLKKDTFAAVFEKQSFRYISKIKLSSEADIKMHQKE